MQQNGHNGSAVARKRPCAVTYGQLGSRAQALARAIARGYLRVENSDIHRVRCQFLEGLTPDEKERIEPVLDAPSIRSIIKSAKRSMTGKIAPSGKPRRICASRHLAAL